MTGPIRVVLDASAVAAYAGESIAVGELIIEVGDEGARVGVPVVCLVEAYRRIPDGQRGRVALLVSHPAVVVVGADSGDWQALAEETCGLGRVDLAAALLLSIDSAAYVLTADPDAYGDKGLPVIPI